MEIVQSGTNEQWKRMKRKLAEKKTNQSQINYYMESYLYEKGVNISKECGKKFDAFII